MKNIILVIFIMLSISMLASCGNDGQSCIGEVVIMKMMFAQNPEEARKILDRCIPEVNDKNCSEERRTQITDHLLQEQFMSMCRDYHRNKISRFNDESCTEENRLILADEMWNKEFIRNCSYYYLPELNTENCTQENINALSLKISDEKLRGRLTESFTRRCTYLPTR